MSRTTYVCTLKNSRVSFNPQPCSWGGVADSSLGSVWPGVWCQSDPKPTRVKLIDFNQITGHIDADSWSKWNRNEPGSPGTRVVGQFWLRVWGLECAGLIKLAHSSWIRNHNRITMLFWSHCVIVATFPSVFHRKIINLKCSRLRKNGSC